MSGAYFKGGKIVGGAEGDTDTFLTQNFDNVSLSDFTQVGLVLEAASPISGTTSAKLVHQTGISQYFAQTKSVPEKYRGASMTIAITAKSGAALGNVTVTFRDVTNSVNIQSSQQIPAESAVGIYQFGFTIPTTCQNFTYTVTALPEAGSPVTYIDDIQIKNYWMGSAIQGQTEHRFDMPAITEWQTYIPTITNQGSIANNNFKWRQVGNVVEVKGTFDTGTALAAVTTMGLPNGYTVMQSASSGYYYNIGSWGRSASSGSHGGLVIAAAGNNHVHFSAASTFGGTASIAMTPSNGTSMSSPGEFLAIEFAVAVNELSSTSPKTFISTDIVPAKSMSSNASIEVPIITDWVDYTPTVTGIPTSASAGDWRRVGDTMHIKFQLTASGVATGAINVGIPVGYDIDETKIVVFNQFVGSASGYDSSANISYAGMMYQFGSSSNTFAFYGPTSGAWSVAVPFTWAVNDVISGWVEIPIVGWDVTETKVWSATQSVITEENDEALQWNDWTANTSSSGTTTFTFTGGTVVSSGSHITYVKDAVNGDRFVINKTGFYAFKANFDYGTPSSGYLGFTRNSPTLSTSILSIAPAFTLGKDYGPDLVACVWSGPLVAGDIIRLQTNGVITSGSGIYNLLSFNYIGSVKQVQTISDQKVQIPTSELRFEGCSSRGSTDTGVVKFDTLARIRGDAFTVTNTAANGTAITINKNGKLDVSAAIYLVTTAQQWTISRNQANLSSIASATETLASGYTNGVHLVTASWSGRVYSGDVIRLSSTVTPIAESRNNFNFFFQEQEVAVSVTNILPQFSENDSCVRVTNTNGHGSTATAIRRFSNIVMNRGTDVLYQDSITLGASFTILKEGMYHISYTDSWSVASQHGITLNQTNLTLGTSAIPATELLATITTAGADYEGNCAISYYLNAGDVIRPGTNAGTSASPTLCSFTISKVGKPNVTGVDVSDYIKTKFDKGQIGEIRAFAGLIDSEFFFPCAGGLYLRTDFPDLFANIGTTYNTGGELATQFRVPDLRGVFLRGLDSGRGLDTGRVLGTYQADIFAIHNHIDGFAGVNATATFGVSSVGAAGNVNSQSGVSTVNHANTSSTGGTETRPKNVAINYGIRFKANNDVFLESSKPAVLKAKKVTNQLGLTASSDTIVSYSPEIDTVNSWDLANNRFLIPETAYYKVYAKTSISKTTGSFLTGEYIRTRILIDGAAFEEGYSYPTGSPDSHIEISSTILLTKGKYVSITGGSNAAYFLGAAGQITASIFTVEKISNSIFNSVVFQDVAARGINTSGTIYGTTTSTLTFDAAKTYDTHGALNATTGIFTSPESGYYKVDCHLLFTAAAYVVSQAILLSVIKNGSQYPSSLTRTPIYVSSSINAEANLSDLVFLSKGDTLSIAVQNERGNTALLAGFNFFSIKKI